jgi:hypothetical protein
VRAAASESGATLLSLSGSGCQQSRVLHALQGPISMISLVGQAGVPMGAQAHFCIACTLAKVRRISGTLSGELCVTTACRNLRKTVGTLIHDMLVNLKSRRARLVAPAIIFLDELDAVVGTCRRVAALSFSKVLAFVLLTHLFSGSGCSTGLISFNGCRQACQP